MFPPNQKSIEKILSKIKPIAKPKPNARELDLCNFISMPILQKKKPA